MTPPAPFPWTERPPIKPFVVLEDAHIADPTKRMTTAARRIIFRPKISENLPHTGIDAALARRYADPNQMNAVAECNSLMMVGVAVVAMVKSRAARNNESYVHCLIFSRDLLIIEIKSCANEKSK